MSPAGREVRGICKKKRRPLSGRPCSPCRRAFTRLSRGCRSTLGHRPSSSRISALANIGAGIVTVSLISAACKGKTGYFPATLQTVPPNLCKPAL